MTDAAGNRALNRAAQEKNDEFYTQFDDIAAELRHYKHHFKDKVVYCNCDDPRMSNFFEYFSCKFKTLGLRRLIASCYKNRDADLFSRHDSEQAVYLEYTGKEGNAKPGREHIAVKALKGDGDFRSPESIALLRQADVVVTNPPFSLFREYVAQLAAHDKKFLIIGNMNAVTYKEIFHLLKDNKIWLGVNNGPKTYQAPDHYEQKNIFIGEDGKKYAKMGNTGWFTNLDIVKRHKDIDLYKSCARHPSLYPKYDNYDAIEVSSVKEIPYDYAGVMGVPISFLDKYNPDQFEIVGMAEDNGRGYSGGVWQGGSIKCLINGRAKFKRIFIRNKKPEQQP